MNKCYIIPVQEQCPNNCSFCISKSRTYDKYPSMLILNDTFDQDLSKLKQLGIKYFEITGGGEPLIHPEIQCIINRIRDQIPDAYIKLYTGGGITKKVTNIDEIDLSIVHYETSVNNLLMGNDKQLPLLQKLALLKQPNVKLRLSLVLLKGAIDSPDKLQQLISLSKPYVDEYVVRTLYPKSPSQALRTDFEFKHPLVRFERSNNVEAFSGLILWSDGKIYRNWELKEVVDLDSIGSQNKTRSRARKY